MRNSRLIVAASVLMVGGIGLGATAPPQRFAEIVRENFGKWDADGDGVLRPDEIDRLTIDPSWKGDVAAAIATIKVSMRSKKEPIESLALADLNTIATKPLRQDRELAPETPEQGPSPEGAAGSGGRPEPARPVVDTLQARFARSARMIRSAKRDLFLDPEPDLDRLRQGLIGDCFFVASVGAMVERDPQSVKGMFRTTEDSKGAFRVAFADGRAVTVPELTDVEFALASTTGDEGMWLPALEKAFGTLRMDARPEEQRSQSMTDAIARGGSMASAIQCLTGHRAKSIRLRPKEPPADPEAFIASVREALVAGTEARRLMGAGTDQEPGVPGINPNHAYAIFAFDAATDTLHMWNPHGNTFKPKGEPGMTNGYPTRRGRFDVPLSDFVRTFRGLVIETDQPIPAKTSRDGASGPRQRRGGGQSPNP